MSNQRTVAINGETSGHDPSVQNQIKLALAQNGGFRRIETAFRQRLDEEGWSQNLTEYITKLFRSGEATTYDDALEKVMQHVRIEPSDGLASNGNTDGVPSLTISRSAAEGGADAVKKELIKVCKESK